MGSSRLPGKVLMDVCGEPVLAHVIHRVRAIRGIDQVVVATSTLAADRVVLSAAEAVGAAVFAGSEQDVLDRYYQAARAYSAEAIVRVTADCPMLDPHVSSTIVDRFGLGETDYVSNLHPPTFPDGLDTEVFSFEALERSWRIAQSALEREHVTRYIRHNPDNFRVANVAADVDRSALCWTLDCAVDLEFVRSVFEHLHRPGGPPFLMADVLELIEREPALARLNARHGE